MPAANVPREASLQDLPQVVLSVQHCKNLTVFLRDGERQCDFLLESAFVELEGCVGEFQV